MTTQIMLDLETMGTRPGSAILSIGAVAFGGDPAKEPPADFYTVISLSSCLRNGLKASGSTWEWWSDQSDAAREVLYEAMDHSTSKSLDTALDDFSAWLSKLPAASPIWGNGSEFDQPLLAAAYVAVGSKAPWSYRDVRCYRTMKALCPDLDAIYVPPTIKHHALEDARAQATHLVKICAKLGIVL